MEREPKKRPEKKPIIKEKPKTPPIRSERVISDIDLEVDGTRGEPIYLGCLLILKII